MRSGMARV